MKNLRAIPCGFSIRSDIKEKLDNYCETNKINKSRFVQNAIQKHLKDNELRDLRPKKFEIIHYPSDPFSKMALLQEMKRNIPDPKDGSHLSPWQNAFRTYREENPEDKKISMSTRQHYHTVINYMITRENNRLKEVRAQENLQAVQDDVERDHTKGGETGGHFEQL